jgi:nucleoside-diphosphate-sugar epimerase
MATSTPEAGPVCVTGATGYIASYVVKLLLERGYTVRGTTRSAAPEKVAHLTSLPGAAERLTLLEQTELRCWSTKLVRAVLNSCTAVRAEHVLTKDVSWRFSRS